MIEFTGHISGAAEKAFWKNGRKIVLVGYLFVFPLVFPILLFFGYLFQSATFIYTFAVCLAIVPIFFFIPKRKKEKAVRCFLRFMVLKQKCHPEHSAQNDTYIQLYCSTIMQLS